MALAVAGLVADGETVIDETACITTSFPGFAEALNLLAGDAAVTVEP
jgi:3-phosphoshikimate 1-carboxyvinyltransferase